MSSRLWLEGISTLLNAVVELIISGEEVIRGDDGRVVGCDGLDQCSQGGFNPIQLALKNSLHGISALISHAIVTGFLDSPSELMPWCLCPNSSDSSFLFPCLFAFSAYEIKVHEGRGGWSHDPLGAPHLHPSPLTSTRAGSMAMPIYLWPVYYLLLLEPMLPTTYLLE